MPRGAENGGKIEPPVTLIPVAASGGRILAAVLVGSVLFFAGKEALSYGLWAYNLSRAVALQEAALSWPADRSSDDLPETADRALNQAALAHFAAAIRWRPDHYYAYRLAARSHAADGQWQEAARLLTVADRLAPGDAMVLWERFLLYERMAGLESTLPSPVALFPQIVPEHTEAPSTPLDTAYCRPPEPHLCYAASAIWARPPRPNYPALAMDTLFLHPPGRQRFPLTIAPGNRTLFFCLGLATQAAAWEGDGAAFSVVIEARSGPATTVFEEYLERSALAEQWHCRTADLAPWEGQPVTLVLATSAGPLGDSSGDWVGWGSPLLTTNTHAELLRSLYALGFDPPVFFERGSEAMRGQAYDEALTWYRRVDYLHYPTRSALAYLRLRQAQDAGDGPGAAAALAEAVTADRGWASPSMRFHAFYLYGVQQFAANDMGGTQATLTHLIAETSADGSISPSLRSDAHLLLARTYHRRRALDLALHHAFVATTLNNRNSGAFLLYGHYLYESTPGNLTAVRNAFSRALDYNDTPGTWTEILRFWQRTALLPHLERDCAAAIARFGAEPFHDVCVPEASRSAVPGPVPSTLRTGGGGGEIASWSEREARKRLFGYAPL